jgi:hypothetical protein
MGNLGYRSSTTTNDSAGRTSITSGRMSLTGDSSTSFGSSASEEVQYHLYCINIRALNRMTYPALAIRQLSNLDNLLWVEESNRKLQEEMWRKYAEASHRTNKPVDLSKVPQFKYVYCSQSMIRQIQNAFLNNEISFPQDTFMIYLKNLVAKRSVGDEGTIIKYHHNFNNISIS